MNIWMLAVLTLLCLALARPLPRNDGSSPHLPATEVLHSHDKRAIPLAILLANIVGTLKVVSIVFGSLAGSKAVGAMAAAFYGIQTSNIIVKLLGASIGSAAFGAAKAVGASIAAGTLVVLRAVGVAVGVGAGAGVVATKIGSAAGIVGSVTLVGLGSSGALNKPTNVLTKSHGDIPKTKDAGMTELDNVLGLNELQRNLTGFTWHLNSTHFNLPVNATRFLRPTVPRQRPAEVRD